MVAHRPAAPGRAPGRCRYVGGVEALVTDLHLRNAIAGLRGLGRGGVSTLATGPSRGAAGLLSRYAGRTAVVTAVEDSPARFVADVGRAAEGVGGAVVYPGQESSLDALIGAAALPASLRLPYPNPGALRLVRDKRALAGLAADAGLGAPTTLVEATVAELRRRPPPLPCAVKPAQPGGALPTARLVGSREELGLLLAGLPDQEALLVQERLKGSLTAVALVVDPEGGPVARFQQRARRTWPPDAGMSSLAVSVAPDEQLIARAAALLGAVGFGGLAHLQFVESDGRHALIDVNPRFYGSLPLALASGVNLPLAWHRMLEGRPGPAAGDYRVGVTYRWLEGDLMAAVRGAPDRLRRPRPRPQVGAVWAADDPRPAIAYAATAIAQRLARRLPANSRRRGQRPGGLAP